MKSLALALAVVILSLGAASAEDAKQYNGNAANPYGEVVQPQPVQPSNIAVEDKKDTIKAKPREITNPTGQVSDDEFEGLVNQSRGSSR